MRRDTSDITKMINQATAARNPSLNSHNRSASDQVRDACGFDEYTESRFASLDHTSVQLTDQISRHGWRSCELNKSEV
jgi:hypothetical protein